MNNVNSKYLKGKKVLFLSWAFYEYPQKIISELENVGAEVTYWCSAPTNNFIKMKLFKKSKRIKANYYDSLLSQIDNDVYDYVFLINAASFSISFIKRVLEIQKDAIKILYLWDSLKVFSQAKDLYDVFDRIYTFDSFDADNNPNMHFLPLFWCEDLYDDNRVELKYDFSFVGFGHSERYSFLKQIESVSRNNGWRCCFMLYLPSKLHYLRGKYITKIFEDSKMGEFVYKSIPQKEISRITLESKIVVDLELKTQSGLTMRTIETHGMRKKLITTNKNVANYDFYNPSNILIVDRDNPIISEEFVNTPYQHLNDTLYYKYSLKNWIYTMFGGSFED